MKFTVYFSRSGPFRTEFTRPSGGLPPKVCVRGKEAFSSTKGSFCLSGAVRALILLVLCEIRARNRNSSGGPEALMGRQGSAAWTLDLAFDKRPTWIGEMFGLDKAGAPFCSRFLVRSNSRGRRDEDVAVSFRPLSRDQVQLAAVNEQGLRLSDEAIEVWIRTLKSTFVRNARTQTRTRISDPSFTDLPICSVVDQSHSTDTAVTSVLSDRIAREMKRVMHGDASLEFVSTLNDASHTFINSAHPNNAATTIISVEVIKQGAASYLVLKPHSSILNIKQNSFRIPIDTNLQRTVREGIESVACLVDNRHALDLQFLQQWTIPFSEFWLWGEAEVLASKGTPNDIAAAISHLEPVTNRSKQFHDATTLLGTLLLKSYGSGWSADISTLARADALLTSIPPAHFSAATAEGLARLGVHTDRSSIYLRELRSAFTREDTEDASWLVAKTFAFLHSGHVYEAVDSAVGCLLERCPSALKARVLWALFYAGEFASLKSWGSRLEADVFRDTDLPWCLAIALYRSGKIKEALQLLESAFIGQPQHFRVGMYLGFMLKRSGHIAESASVFARSSAVMEECLVDNPTNVHVRAWKCRLLAMKGDHQGASKEIKTIDGLAKSGYLDFLISVPLAYSGRIKQSIRRLSSAAAQGFRFTGPAWELEDADPRLAPSIHSFLEVAASESAGRAEGERG